MPIRQLLGTLILGLLVFGALAAVAPRSASALSDIFTVSDIDVDVTAATAAAARETAHAEGHVLAMRKLLERLLPRDELARMRSLEFAEVLQYVQDFEVANERTSDVRYLARLTFRFKAEAVRALLRAEGLVFAETRSKPVLVLGVYGPANAPVLWEDTNAWSQTWAVRKPEERLVPLQVPLGDLRDVTTIDATQALAGDRPRLAAVAQRYGSEDVLVTQAFLRGDPESGSAILQVGSSRLGTQQLQTMLASYAQQPGESLNDLLARAAEGVDADMQESWKQRNLLRPGSRRRIVVSVPISTLADWLEVKRRLGAVAAVQSSEITLLSRRRTELDLTFVGDEQQLILAMAQSDLDLTLNPVSGWQIHLASAAPAQTETPAPTPGGGPAVGSQTITPAN